MAKTSIKLRASSFGTKEGTLYFLVIHQRAARQIRTEYRIFTSEWDAAHACILLPADKEDGRYAHLLSVKEGLEADNRKLQSVIARLDREAQPFTADRVVEYYRMGKDLKGIIGYAQELCDRLHAMGKTHITEKYTTCLNRLKRYLKGDDLPLEELDGTFLMGFEQWLKDDGLCRNTTSFYMRNLRAIYNHAVEDRLVEDAAPFRHVYTGIDQTTKRALPQDKLRELKGMDLADCPHMEFARDMFLFSFYTRGMSFIDMARLTQKNLRDGVLTYRRQKTAQLMHIKWEKLMDDIVRKHHVEGSDFLLPLADDTEAPIQKRCRNTYCRINKQLKKLGQKLGLSIPLTTYVARHSWASTAKSNNVEISVISEALGHESEKTTRIYLASLDTSVIDAANCLVINSL